MKLNFKKTLAVFICAALAAASVSCGSSDDSSSASSSSTSSESTTSMSYYDPPMDIDYETDGTAKVSVDGTEFVVGGETLWINGVNTPWDQWNDFGGNFNYAFWDLHFQELEDTGINATRIWINCSSMVGVILNEDGSFNSVTDSHWQDLDVLFTIAKKHGIYIMATLLSFDHFKDENDYYDYWRSMITDSDNIGSFVEGYVVPFVERYDSCDYLWSVDLMNEPDWVYENEECGQIGWENISNYFARAAAAIHENSDVLVTVGFGVVKYNSDSYEGNYGSDEYLQSLSGNENSYLDFYSTHFYNWELPYYGLPYIGSPTDFLLDGTKPCVIGECAAYDYTESGITLESKYEDAYNNGWNGVMAWTSNGVDDRGNLENIEPAAAKILELAESEVYPLGRSSDDESEESDDTDEAEDAS